MITFLKEYINVYLPRPKPFWRFPLWRESQFLAFGRKIDHWRSYKPILPKIPYFFVYIFSGEWFLDSFVKFVGLM